jgi:hypothetical protein
VFEFKGMHDIDARAPHQRLGEFHTVRLLSLCLCLRRPVTPNTPRASYTVATFGFPRLYLCLTRDRWTAEFGVRGLVTVPSLLAKP